jgi:rhodanese-related sulfurtransferase
MFKRITRNSLARLIKNNEAIEESVYDFRPTDAVSEYSVTSTAESLDIVNIEYMLLDIRDADEFKVNHIVGATNFPAALLRRDAFTREMHQFRNRDRHIVVIYHNDENRYAKEAATLFYEKGYANIRLLTHGLYGMYERFPHRVWGDVKLPSSAASSRMSSAANTRQGSRAGSTYSGMTGGRSGRISPRDSLARQQHDMQSNLSKTSVFRQTGQQTLSRGGSANGSQRSRATPRQQKEIGDRSWR